MVTSYSRYLAALVWVWSVVATVDVGATTYYIANGGSDAGSCTEGAPCATFNELIEGRLTAGTHDGLVRCGDTFRETTAPITAAASGTSSNKITLGAYGDCYERAGVHEGSNNATTLVDVGTNFSTVGVVAGDRVFNLSKGAHCYVGSITTTSTTNDTLVCTMDLAHTLAVDWDTGDRYVVHNKPVITHAALFNSGWTNHGSNVWSHTTTKHAGRHVWINGLSTHDMLHDGTCSISGMGSATDMQFCAICDSGSAMDCGPGKVYIKSTSNPATRWTNPGVEVVQAWDHQTTLFALSTRQHWVVSDIAIEKVYGTPMTLAGSNVTIDRVRLGQSQRKNCDTSCWSGNSYSWQAGQDDRGGQLLGMGASTPTSGIVVSNFLGHDCENNCITMSGVSSVTATLTDIEVFNNDHSILMTGLSTSSTSSRNVAITRMNLHGAATFWHSGGGGATQTITVTHSLFYDTSELGDPRQITPAGRADPYGIFLEDNGTYTITESVITTGGHGIRTNDGDLVIQRSIIQDNAQSGINASAGATVRINDSIIADNGSGAVSGSSFQVGCSNSCTSATLFHSGSNNNKFRQPGGGPLGYFSGVDTAMTFTEFQTRFDGNASSVTTASCFVDAAGMDYNLATGCDDLAAGRGPFREMALSNYTQTGTTGTATWSVGGTLPLSACDVSAAVVKYDSVNQTETACVASLPLSNTATLTLSAAPQAGDVVSLAGLYGLVQDSRRIGGYLNAKSRAFGDTSGQVPTTGWIVGTQRDIPAGSNRLLLVGGCFEKNAPSASPLDFTGCTYGGQAMTKIADANSTDSTDVLATLWYLNEAGIAAATTTTLGCTTDEAAEAGRPIILASAVYPDIDQGVPILDSETATHLTASSLSTAALSPTSNPGVAVVLACAGNEGSWAPGSGWTEQADVCEDTDCGTRMHVADRDTTGDTPAGSATFTTSQAFSNRLAMIAVSLDGGDVQDPNPQAVVVRTETATRCAYHNEALWQWLSAENGACTIVSGGKTLIISQYAVSGADESTAVGKQLQCCDSGACTDPSEFYAVNDTTGNVRYLDSPTIAHGQAISSRQLSNPGGTFVAGAIIEQDSMVPQALTTGQHSEVGHVVQVLAPADSTVTCRLALDDNTPLNTYTQSTTLAVVSGLALGF